MKLQDLLLIRHELLLTLTALILIVAEIFIDDKSKKKIVPLALFLMIVVTAAGILFPVNGTAFGGMYQTDALRSAMKTILDIATVIIILQSYGWVSKKVNQNKTSEFYILMISTLVGMNFMISSGDFLMLYLGLELATIPIAAMAAFDRHKSNSAEAGIKLILSSALSSAVLLYGLSLIYGTTGSIYFEEVRAAFRIEPLPILGLVFFVTGMGFKISLVPFHLWTADVYEGSPIAVTSFLSVVSKGAAVFIFTFVLYTVFAPVSAFWSQVLVVLSVTTMTVGNLFALRQENMKRFLAFSSIAQAGFILLGILGQGEQGFGSVIFFLLVYVFTNLAAFSVVAAISDKTGKENMADYNGLYKTNPNLSLIMMLALFSLAGIPPVAGFFGKLFLFSAAASNGYYWLLFVAVMNATISLYYYLRPVRAMFIEKNDNPIPTFKSDIYMRIGIAVSVAGIFLTGFISAIYEYYLSISNLF
ncbi:MAG TPA: NADH-quinone oxidoreductase subunit N [Marinilabiliales bacterium]|jgi:NADH-quinone oxidoreductase subunit N|nr:NADH-quinone oxidoreductase subunit N [Marinilabiliales bacterium]HAZ04889.1 NADH-quinone oxidoreductase subunit N [Marinilabiliales bacterium]HBO73929.1 NADH-quinone oxidoreductase subunit N [Marinilabiliales bacterium]HBX84674.1 NADH-quinone oxidoreductase subunit N [Marinilabiliales bacterium]HBY52383.1 NADH-quinone oxidoreductase subunit N [Marinilabiliales bacterium]